MSKLTPPTGRISFETRVRAVVVTLIVVSALSANVSELKTMWDYRPQRVADDISPDEKRLAPLKKVLPERGVVGFVTDAATRNEHEKRRYIAGYVLAPLIVAAGADWPLVIGDFADPAAASRTFDGALRVRQDFGNGLVLFAAEKR